MSRPSRVIVGMTAAAALGLAGCTLVTEPDGPFADVAGSWTYAAEQSSPVLDIDGTLTLTQQRAALGGALAFAASDGIGPPANDGGPVSGLVIGTTDVDFDVQLPSGARRHVARVSAGRDTIEGAWVHLSSGAAGVFLATRDTP